jgi:hypothetical protein
VSLGYSPSGPHARKKLTGRIKAEVREKLKGLYHAAVQIKLPGGMAARQMSSVVISGPGWPDWLLPGGQRRTGMRS